MMKMSSVGAFMRFRIVLRENMLLLMSITRVFLPAFSVFNLFEIHLGVCHNAMTQLMHFVLNENLSSLQNKLVCSSCSIYVEIIP